jgi:cell division septation protein DedD
MKTFVKTFLSILVLAYLFISCSSSEETQVKKEEVDTDTVYVFDEIPPEDIFEFETPVQQSIDVYVVQIGAFSSFDRAKEFADQSWTKLDKEIKVEYKQTKNLYVVWIYPPFQDKQSAEVYRIEIQKGGEFKDAWIVKVESKK